jgi:hypothetical protein
MSNNSGLAGNLWSNFISSLFQTGEISVSDDFHDRCGYVAEIMDNDVTGIVSTVIDYSINSASEAKFRVECSEESLEDLLNLWLEQINININGVPTGLQELAKEYYKERWAGSSLCLLRVDKWKSITKGANSITVPTVLYFVIGSSVYIKRSNAKNYKLGSDKYFLNKDLETSPIPANKEEKIVVQKPFGRWFTEYPTPYLIKQGVYKNWKSIQILQNKGNEVITKILPYLFMMQKGTENMYLQDKGEYTDAELKTMVDNFKDAVERYNKEGGKLPATAVPFDQKYEHLIPDLLPILREELYAQGSRSILSGLGFIDVVQGVSSTRKESVLNPKPFVAEVNAGVDGFKTMLMDIIGLIVLENKGSHKKLFSDNTYLKIISSPLKINVETLIDSLRSAFVYGTISIKTYQEMLQIDPEQELERMRKEWEIDKDGYNLRQIYYPHSISNQEDKGLDTELNVKPTITKKQEEKKVEKEKVPPTMNKAEIIDDLEIAPYTKENHPKYLDKYPQEAIDLWIKVFNESLPKGEDYAFPVAWSTMKKFLRRHYIKNPDGTYTKKG